MGELESVEGEAKQARHRLARGGYELVFAASSIYIVAKHEARQLKRLPLACVALLTGGAETGPGDTSVVTARVRDPKER